MDVRARQDHLAQRGVLGQGGGYPDFHLREVAGDEHVPGVGDKAAPQPRVVLLEGLQRRVGDAHPGCLGAQRVDLRVHPPGGVGGGQEAAQVCDQVGRLAHGQPRRDQVCGASGQRGHGGVIAGEAGERVRGDLQPAGRGAGEAGDARLGGDGIEPFSEPG